MAVAIIGRYLDSKAPGSRAIALHLAAKRNPGHLHWTLLLRSLIGGIQGSGWKTRSHSLVLYRPAYGWMVLYTCLLLSVSFSHEIACFRNRKSFLEFH
jgi:hypothetical protein